MTTIVIGDNTGNTAGVADAGISQSAPDSEGGPYAGNYLAASATACGRILYKFTGLPSGPVTVSSAILTLNNADSAGATTGVQLRKLLTAFSEADATWNNRQTGTPWNVAGVIGGTDVDSTVLATGTAPTGGGTTFNVSGAGFTALVEGWINGTVTNNGCIVSLVSDTSAGESYRLRTKESADGVRPILTIVYTAGGGGATISTITGTTVTEASSVVFTATMSGSGGGTFSYSWSGTATSADYTQTLTNGMFAVTGGSGSVTVSGSNITVDSTVTAFTVTVPTTTDTLDEDNETVRLVIGGVTSSSGTINDDDAQPSVTIGNATESGGTVTHVATLSAASGKTITFDYATADGSATAGVDYTSASGTVTFSPGETTKNILITAL